jgi:hypothetical protein
MCAVVDGVDVSKHMLAIMRASAAGYKKALVGLSLTSGRWKKCN